MVPYYVVFSQYLKEINISWALKLNDSSKTLSIKIQLLNLQKQFYKENWYWTLNTKESRRLRSCNKMMSNAIIIKTAILGNHGIILTQFSLKSVLLIRYQLKWMVSIESPAAQLASSPYCPAVSYMLEGAPTLPRWLAQGSPRTSRDVCGRSVFVFITAYARVIG